MKFLGQLSLAVIVIVALVAGVTFIAQYQSGTVPPPTQTNASMPVTTAGPMTELTFTLPVVDVEGRKLYHLNWDPPWQGEFEEHTGGHYDFWFTNETETPIEVGFVRASCKCTSIEVCTFTPEKAQKYKLATNLAAVNSATMTATGTLQGFVQFMAETVVGPKVTGTEPNWQVALATDARPYSTTGLPVPPKQSGMVRVIWAPRKEVLSAQLLSVELWTRPQEGQVRPRLPVHLEVPVTFVPAIRVAPVTRNLEDVASRETRAVEFICWSSTLASFPLEVFDKEHHPCIIAESTPIGKADRDDHISRLTKSRVLSAYHVKVTLHEQLDDTRQMDLGAFHRYLVFRSSPDMDDGIATLSGVVRGEVTVGDEKTKGKASLGSFKTSRGATVNVPISAERYGLELDTEPSSIRFEPPPLTTLLQVKLIKASGGPGRRGRWNLQLNVGPDVLSGSLPERSAIYLKTVGANSRQVRIPVEALGYQ